MRRVNQAELEAALSLPHRPAQNPDPLYGQPELKAALSLLLAGKAPLFLVTPPGFDEEGHLGGFLKPRLAALPPDPALALLPRGERLELVQGSPKEGRLLRPAGPPAFRFLPEPEETTLFGRFLPRSTPRGAVLTYEDYEPGALLEVGSGVLLISAEALARRPGLAEALLSAVRRGGYTPSPPPAVPAPAFPELPVKARLLVAAPAEAIEALPLPQEAWVVAARETLAADRRSLSWLWGYLRTRTGRLSRKEFRSLASWLRRQAGHREKISLELKPLYPLLAARKRGLSLEEALRRLEEAKQAPLARFLEELREGLWTLELTGRRVGEAVGLLVIEEVGGSYGRPARITASAAPGREGVVSIEREVQLAGPLFGKAVLTLAGYLRRRYAEVGPLSASIQIVFEQTSEAIDGDSAGLAELLAVLSALSGLPLRQDRAITGAVDQTGRVLPVGGIPEKAEGLVAAARALGAPGVGLLLPRANLPHLIAEGALREALAEGFLEVYAVETVDEAIELAFGRSPSRVHRAVAERLSAFKKLEDGER